MQYHIQYFNNKKYATVILTNKRKRVYERRQSDLSINNTDINNGVILAAERKQRERERDAVMQTTIEQPLTSDTKIEI